MSRSGEAQPTAHISTPLQSDDRWVFRCETTKSKVVVSAKTWYDAITQAAVACGVTTEALTCVFNPVTDYEP